jgi:pantoate--beta-alanine ligase
MHIHPHIASLRSALPAGQRIALVPTMGALHEGHMALIAQARESADCVVASIFVNRLQFRPGEDFDHYPRPFAADCAQLESAGVDILFNPDDAEIYPDSAYSWITPPPELADILEGAYRPGFFRGVATVVMKLFQIVSPHIALFGKKDYQQQLIIGQMVQALNLPLEIKAVDTVRAPDGLALSSRNAYLSTQERAQAPQLFQTLRHLRSRIHEGDRDFTALESHGRQTLDDQGFRTDYIAIRRKIDLQFPLAHDSGLVILAAAHLGRTRLIDNLEV